MNEDTKTQPANDNSAAQWGLASMLIGSLVLVGWPIGMGLLFGSLVAVWHSPMLQSSDLDLGIIGGWLLIAGIMGLALLGLFCGIIGSTVGAKRGQPRGLALAGTLVSLVAVAAMAVFILAGRRSDEWIRWVQKERYEKGIEYPVMPHK